MRCKRCSQYTLEGNCPTCGVVTSKPHPSRFSPMDKYGDYRRKLKLESMRGKG